MAKRRVAAVLFGMAALSLMVTGCEMDEESGNSPGSAITLTDGQWTSGSISQDKDGNYDVKWYTFTAASADKIYRIQWADSDQYGAYTPVPTCDIFVTAYQSDKTTVLLSQTGSGFSPARAISGYAGTVYLKVESSIWARTGTYAIKYFEEGDAVVSLTADTWKSATIEESDEIDWYKFDVADAGKIYRIQWADSSQYGAYTPVPTCDIYVTAYQSDKTTVLLSQTGSGYSPARAISGYAGTVYLKVESSWASSTGTYAIKYFEEGDAVVSLSAGNWVNASITESGEVDTYTFTAQSGTTYNIYWADSSQYGAYNPTPTCNISVTAYQSDLATTFFADQNSAFTTPKTISGYTGTVYLKVKGDWPSTAGTYAIRYTTP